MDELTFVEFYQQPLQVVGFLAAWGLAMLTTLVIGQVQR